MSGADQQYRFEISLSVLNHLGRGLYRDIITILGEAISNSWDADATNVWINFDKEASRLVIMDDGEGMDENDFQNKFLKIGYSKRKDQTLKSIKRSHPFIGAKGIGKLALLSCSKRISIFSKKKSAHDYIGGLIDNSGLDEAIKGDKNVEEYNLQKFDLNLIKDIKPKPDSGTILVFDGLRDNFTKHTPDYYRKMIALYFNFSIFDNDFKIYFNESVIDVNDLKSLIDSTEFVWVINKQVTNNFLNKILSDEPSRKIVQKELIVENPGIKGFIASVKKPRDLHIPHLDEGVTIDLFVNGRLREKNIIKRIPSHRIVEDYLYGQIHFDELDSGEGDPFTSSRDGVKSDNEKFQSLLEQLRPVLSELFEEWDILRVNRSEDGDDYGKALQKKERRARSYVNEVSKNYFSKVPDNAKKKTDKWLKDLQKNAVHNLDSYVNCFISENILRMFILDQKCPIAENLKEEAKKYRTNEKKSLNHHNISGNVREQISNDNLISYLGINRLAAIVEGTDKKDATEISLNRDIELYSVLRNVVGHTGILSEVGAKSLDATCKNMHDRVTNLLRNKLNEPLEEEMNIPKTNSDVND